jgi:proteasome lid subunit RPN8/RPN11
MFPIYLADRRNMNPKDDICYIVAKNGLFVKKKLGIMESITPVKDVPSLEYEVVPYAKMKLPKISKPIFCSIFSVFRKVYELYRSESTALLFYNEKKKKFKVGIPYQKVSFASVEAIKMGSPQGYITVASVHSHCNFSAFHSGTDITDEEYIEGLHITIGNVDEDQFSLVASIVSNGKRFKVDPLDFINGIDENLETENTKLKYLIVGGYIENYNPEWLNFISGTKYEPSVVTKFTSPFYDAITFKDIKNYGQYFRQREESKNKLHDPCQVCPFSREKEPELTVEDLFFGYGD